MLDDPESKVLKSGWASRGEQRERRPGLRHAVHTELKQLPEFANEDEEREFWDTHDSTEYVDWSKAKRAKGSKKKWCKGKLGIEHNYKPIPIKEKWSFVTAPADEIKHESYGGRVFWFERCTKCGRTEFHSENKA